MVALLPVPIVRDLAPPNRISLETQARQFEF
jgi:hypothetical protein